MSDSRESWEKPSIGFSVSTIPLHAQIHSTPLNRVMFGRSFSGIRSVGVFMSWE